MTKTKWIMKQYWRVGTIRAVLALALSMFVLGRLYYVYIPGISELGVLGALLFGSLLVLLFMGLGWLYDEKTKMWSSQNQAVTERAAYYYVPEYRSLAIEYPTYNAILRVLRNILDKARLETKVIDDILSYLDDYFVRSTNRSDIFTSLPDSETFLNNHPFVEKHEITKRKISFISRIKLGFQVELLRLTWIQSLTGLIQDTLVFGVMSMTVLYFGGAEGVLPMNLLILSIVLISIPLFIILTLLGWLYDKRMRVWSPNQIVIVERNPYTFLAEPALSIRTLPIFNAILLTLRDVIDKAGIDCNEIDKILEYISEYQKLDVSRDESMKEAQELRASFGELFKYQESI